MKRLRPSQPQGRRFSRLPYTVGSPRVIGLLLPFACSFIAVTGCTKYRDDLEYNHPVENVWFDSAASSEISLFQGVHWEPATSVEFSNALKSQSLAQQRTVLDLFCGPGVIAMLCARADAKSVLAVAEDAIAASCARYNVAASQTDQVVTVRDLELHSSPVLPATSKFELITAVLFEPMTSPDRVSSPNANMQKSGLPKTVTLARKIDILLECIGENLTPSGMALIACENESVEQKLGAACAKAGHTVSRVSPPDVLMPVYEIKPAKAPPSSATKAALPAKSPDSEGEP